jgi:hypothetical protein
MLVHAQHIFIVKILLPNDVLLKVELTSKLMMNCPMICGTQSYSEIITTGKVD